MKMKRKAFVKKFSWFLLISGSSLILTCWSWSQIWVSVLGRDIPPSPPRFATDTKGGWWFSSNKLKPLA